MNNRKLMNFGFIFTIALSFALFSGCSNESPVTPTSYNTSLGMFAATNTSDNTMAITEVKFLLRKIDLHSENIGDEEMCMGPLVIDINAAEFSKVINFSFSTIAPDVYDEIHFQLHKPSPNENISDPEFTESTSRRYSVIVKGLYNGESFVYKTDVTVSKEVDFEGKPVRVPASSTVNITIRISPYDWFLSNGVLLDPMDSASKHLIDQNIRNSFRHAFKDDNEDGMPD
jgi:hypothetical protein